MLQLKDDALPNFNIICVSISKFTYWHKQKFESNSIL